MRVPWIAGPKLQPRPARGAVPRHLHAQVRSEPNQVFADRNNCHRCRWKPQSGRQPGPEQFIDQDARMLWIILEFYDVVVAVVATHKMRLRATSHPPYLL